MQREGHRASREKAGNSGLWRLAWSEWKRNLFRSTRGENMWKLILSIGTVFLVLSASACIETNQTIFPTPSPTSIPATSSSEVTSSHDIGASWDGFIQIKYSSFTPIVSRSEAIATARDWLKTGFNIPAEEYPVDSTVALISGKIELNATRYEEIGTDIKAWIVVIKRLPTMGSAGPSPDPRHPVKFNNMWQASVAIDATTGKLITAQISGRGQRIPISLNAFPVQYLPLLQDDISLLGSGQIVLDNGYLRIGLENLSSCLLIWPPGYEVIENDSFEIVVIYDYKPLAKIGDRIEVFGRVALPGEDIQNLLTFPLPEEAQGPYWLVASIK